MIKLSKLTDYGILVLTHLARAPAGQVFTARELAAAVDVPHPTVSKVLKTLGRKGVVTSHRGVKGGYCLALAPAEISVARVIDALEGPIALTECIGPDPTCGQDRDCGTRDLWTAINVAVYDALDGISLHDFGASGTGGLVHLPRPADARERR